MSSISFPHDWIWMGKKNARCEVTTTKNVHLWELPFLSVLLIIAAVWYGTPSHALFWKNKPPVKCKNQDGWQKYFLAIPFLLPCMAVDAGCSEKGRCRGIKKQRGKQKTWWLPSAGEVPHGGIRTVWTSSLPSTHSWVVSMYVAGAGSMCEAFIFLQLCSSTCPSGKMCVGCLGSCLNKCVQKKIPCRSSQGLEAQGRDYSPALCEQPRRASRGRSRPGQINHR